MQTFLPYPSFAQSARVLDRARLGKQRVETLQILQVLTGNRLVSSVRSPAGGTTPLARDSWRLEARHATGWSHHPAVLMWNGHLPGLLDYQRAICAEWTARGYRDTCWEKSVFLVQRSGLSPGPIALPSWWGSDRFHAAHRATLLTKDPDWYGQFGWTDVPDPDGLWPVARS